MATCVYIVIGILGVYMFGSKIGQSILQNVGLEKSHSESYFLLFIYAIVLLCHIPFLFYVGKEAMLLIIDEWINKSLSRELEQKLREIELSGDNNASFTANTS